MIKEFFQKYKSKIISISIIFFIGILYLIIMRTTPFRIPCMFNKITGLACPGCGISHFCVKVSHFDFKGAAKENLGITILLPIWGLFIILKLTTKSSIFKRNGILEKVLAALSCIFLIIFGILRNLPGFEFLLPSYFTK